MGLFRDHFHWRSLATLPIGVISILLAIAALLSRFDGQHGAAIVVFVVATLAIVVRFVHAAVVSEHSRANRITFGVACSLLVIAAAAYVIVVTWPRAPLEGKLADGKPATATQPQSDGTRPLATAPPGNTPSAPDSSPSAGRGGETSPIAGGNAGPFVPAPQPSIPLPPAKVFGPAPGAVECPPFVPENAPNVTLSPGDLIVAGGGGVYRLDRDMRETRITRGDHVIDARGVAVAPDGQIYLSTRACGRGAIVQVDPKTGAQTPRFFGFGTPMGVYTDGNWLLVGDENPGGGRAWGELWQIDLQKNERTSIHTFTRDAVATGIAREPATNDLYFAVRRTVYRLDGNESGALRPLDFDGLVNVHALAITPRDELYVGEYDQAKILQMKRGTSTALRTIPGFSTFWNLAASSDGMSLFAAAGSGTNAKVYRVPLAEGEKPIEVWTARGDGFAVFVTVVGG